MAHLLFTLFIKSFAQMRRGRGNEESAGQSIKKKGGVRKKTDQESKSY